MSLKHFHILFVTMAAALCLAFAWWCVQSFKVSQELAYAASAVGAAVGAVALLVYGIAFYRKIGRLPHS